jgi:hypothetical protein
MCSLLCLLFLCAKIATNVHNLETLWIGFEVCLEGLVKVLTIILHLQKLTTMLKILPTIGYACNIELLIQLQLNILIHGQGGHCLYISRST